MPTPPPYDRTTPPFTPRSSNHSQIPRLVLLPQATESRVDPRDGQPAVWPRDPRPPREYGPQDDLYYAFTRDADAYLSSGISAVREMVNRQARHTHRVPSSDQTQRTQLRLTIPKPEGDTKMAQAASRQIAVQLAPLPAPKPPKEPKPATSKLGPAVKATEWVAKLRKKRRPSEIFDTNFSFGVASCRRSSDRSPQISPRTSISSVCVSPSPSIEEFFKRQRIDSSGSEMAQGISFGRPTPVTIPKGRDTRSPAMLPRDSASQAPTTPLPRPRLIGAEAHPGQLVEFTDPGYDAPVLVPSPMSEYKLRIGTEAYHDYLATSRRTKSFPSSTGATRRQKDEIKMLSRLEKLDTEAKEFGTNKTCPTSRKRACTLERRVRTSRKSAPRFIVSSETVTAPSTPIAPSPSSTMGDSVMLRRTRSDPSTDAFLTHVRASLEARKEKAAKWQNYPVFADEIEKGFLGDEPL